MNTNEAKQSPDWLPDLLSQLLARRDLEAGQMRQAMSDVMSGRCGDAELAAFLIALRMKGESVVEIATAAAVLREHMVRLDTGRDDVLDTCGTGGDGAGTFNISTATAFVVAAAGVPVVKHGNRAVSSRSGSADVLAELGAAIDQDAASARRCLDESGLAFCFAPRFHPALQHVGGVRRRLKVHTLFNCLGPLLNPAGTPYQLLGVGRPGLLELLAGALRELGVRRALLVCSQDGLDEVSLSAPTQVIEVRERHTSCWQWTARDFDLEPCRLEELHADGPVESAAIIRGILDGKTGPATRMVLANAAAALIAAERASQPAEGVHLARQAIASGKARQVLDRFVALSKQQTAISEQPSAVSRQP